ncbi:MAG: uracil phosphoribosyltransferase [Puniceicoccales bacterium]|nr:uracil phosphoribosyltransferase [Puniceicoccales bacterium]
MALHIVNHPLGENILVSLRNRDTTVAEYHALCRRIGVVLFVKACENLDLKLTTTETPLCKCEGKILANPIALVPILRAGLALLAPALDLIPEASVGYFGLRRSEKEGHPEPYYQNLPPIADANVFILDPMIATGSTASFAIRALQKFQPKSIGFISILAAPEGIRHLMDKFPHIDIYTIALDRGLDEKNFILPGLGDFGDRFHGTT